MKTLTKLILTVIIIVAVAQIPSVKKEIKVVSDRLEISKLNYLNRIDKLENEADVLKSMLDKQADVNFEQDAKLSVLSNRLSELEDRKEERKPFWRR